MFPPGCTKSKSVPSFGSNPVCEASRPNSAHAFATVTAAEADFPELAPVATSAVGPNGDFEGTCTLVDLRFPLVVAVVVLTEPKSSSDMASDALNPLPVTVTVAPGDT